MLNQQTFFSIHELNDDFDTPSAVHVIYGDHGDSEDVIDTAGLSSGQLSAALQAKVAHGLSLSRDVPRDNNDRSLPVATVEAHRYVKHLDDEF